MTSLEALAVHWETGEGAGPCRLLHTKCGDWAAVLYAAPVKGAILHASQVMEPRGVREFDLLHCMTCNHVVNEGELRPERWAA